MVIMYCNYHKCELDEESLDIKNCLHKNNGRKKCRHLKILNQKPKYRRDRRR